MKDESIKLCLAKSVAIFLVFLSASCSAESQAGKKVDEEKKARNKQTALKNEAVEITRLAQKLEQQGRAMELFRQAGNEENMRECRSSMEDAQKQVSDLDARIKTLPERYVNRLIPIIADLNECVSCSKKAMTSCVKARSTTNEAIKEMFPQ